MKAKVDGKKVITALITVGGFIVAGVVSMVVDLGVEKACDKINKKEKAA